MEIPFATIERISTYLRCLKRLKEKGIKKVSSKELSGFTKTTPEQIRKDLSYFGRFGKTGAGYDVSHLTKKLERILKHKKIWNVCIIGAGSLGSALAKYNAFKTEGYDIVALFDKDPQKIGNNIGGKEIYSIESFPEIAEKIGIEIAILTVPQEAIEEIEPIISKSKIRGIINFVPQLLNIKTRRKITTLDVDLAQKMYILSYLIKNKKEE